MAEFAEMYFMARSSVCAALARKLGADCATAGENSTDTASPRLPVRGSLPIGFRQKI